ncbi:hypothetical protein GCM10009576_042310 [Streptomyces rhizosphaericus]|uniref:HTH-type transcriptional regulator AraC-type N-terminal domain-containing protein n=1 Tax=Streptomyces rhizosphaericus TaxID=114699 RepID=A0ABN1SBD0_9ACTN
MRALHRATGDEFLGLGTIRSRPGTFAMMCYVALGCPDLGTAVERGARVYRLFPGGPHLALDRGAGRGREAVFALRGGLGPHEDALTAAESHIVAEWLMLVWHRVAGWLIGRRIPLLWAQFAYPPPPYAEDYEPLFGCPPRFGAPRTAAGIDRRWLTAPVVSLPGHGGRADPVPGRRGAARPLVRPGRAGGVEGLSAGPCHHGGDRDTDGPGVDGRTAGGRADARQPRRVRPGLTDPMRDNRAA